MEAASQRATGLEERAIDAEVEARAAQGEVARLGVDLAQLEERAAQVGAEALAATQERDAALQRLRELEVARAVGAVQRTFLRVLFGV